MNYEDVQKLSNAAKNKIGLLNGNFLKYFLRAVMAGFLYFQDQILPGASFLEL